MSRQQYLFTSESVSEGHPDKVCDRISDAVVDLFLAADPQSRAAVETLTTTNRVVLAGETRGPSSVNDEVIEQAARECVKQIGYEQEGFDWRELDFQCYLHEQSSDIAQGVDASDQKDEGAGDQGIMFGYACTETEDFMPAPIHYSHRILQDMASARHSGAAPLLGPDAKSQVTLLYENGVPVKATSVVVSTQHTENASQEEIRELVRGFVTDVLPEGWMPAEDELYVNPTGRFVVGGPDGDAGLTGRKIIVDTYGGAAPHGGGAFSGKDPTKVDRSAAYATRYLAKNIVAAGFAPWVDIQISYAIGVALPQSIYVNVDDKNPIAGDQIEAILPKVMDLTPAGIRDHLKLDRPIYAKTAAYGHFGREPGEDGTFTWEKTDLIDALKAAL
ncbi:MAG: methionine adenosyltransferase [Hyphomicrobiales bacterium]|nr:methionine adenosyltransferase [Hyphomicrobiales bacterium]